MPASPASRIIFLEAVRGVAAACVVVQHVLAHEFDAYRVWSSTYFDLGRVGVVAFFLVSGYVIPLSLGHQSLGVFATRRFFRLFPVYWLALILLVAAEPSSIAESTPIEIAFNTLMVHGLVGMVSILPVAWTLSIELLFYLQCSIAKWRGLLDRTVHLGWFWLALYLVICVGERILSRDLPATLPLLLYVAAVGQALHLRDARGDTSWTWLFGGGTPVVVLGAYIAGPVGDWRPLPYSLSFIGGLLLFLLFYVAPKRLGFNGLVWFGSLSYALYLFHAQTMDALSSWGVTGALLLLSTFTLGSLVAYVVHHLIELPSQSVGRRLTRRPTTAISPRSNSKLAAEDADSAVS